MNLSKLNAESSITLDLQLEFKGDVSGPLASGKFESAAAVGGGQVTDRRGEKTQE